MNAAQSNNPATFKPSGMRKKLSRIIYLGAIAIPTLFAFGGGGDPTVNSEWRNTDIYVTITAPENNSALLVNEEEDCSATAVNTHEYSNDSGANWYPYSEDVTSGTTSTDYHIWWTVSVDEGTDAGSFTDMYGPNTTYIAPAYSASYAERNITMTASARELLGAHDLFRAPIAHVHVGQVKQLIFQIVVSADQGPGNVVGANYAAAILPKFGGGQLGIITPGAPAGATGFRGATECKAEGPAGMNYASIRWREDKYGSETAIIGGVNQVVYGPTTAATADVDLGPNKLPVYRDTTGPIYMFDAPGLDSNDANINLGATAYHHDMNYVVWVLNKPGGVQVSNSVTWQVQYDLVVNGAGAAWVLKPGVGHTPP